MQISPFSPSGTPVALYGYAHLPALFYPQTRIDERDLPSTEQKLAIMQRAIAYLLDAGYVYIGMDHFARPDDELALAQREGALPGGHRPCLCDPCLATMTAPPAPWCDVYWYGYW